MVLSYCVTTWTPANSLQIHYPKSCENTFCSNFVTDCLIRPIYSTCCAVNVVMFIPLKCHHGHEVLLTILERHPRLSKRERESFLAGGTLKNIYASLYVFTNPLMPEIFITSKIKAWRIYVAWPWVSYPLLPQTMIYGLAIVKVLHQDMVFPQHTAP